MEDKSSYRNYLLRMMKFVKLSAVCKECGVSQPALNYFLNKDRDELLSVDKLESLCDFIRNLDKVA